MDNQEKRGRGRPSQGKATRHTDLTLSIEALAALQEISDELRQKGEIFNRSRFIDNLIKGHPVVAEKIHKKSNGKDTEMLDKTMQRIQCLQNNILPYSDIANNEILNFTAEGVVKMLLRQIELRDAKIAELDQEVSELQSNIADVQDTLQRLDEY